MVDKTAAVARARREFEEEQMKEAVRKLKAKYAEMGAAQTVLDNVKREVADLEEAIEQGNA